jgi:cytochrome c peroxidase
MKKTVLLVIYSIFLSTAFKSLNSFEEYQPSHFPPPVYNFAKNPFNKASIQLGRILFYDPILSIDNTISCASCHSPYNAFAHTDHTLSHGINDQIGTRNAPALMNLAWQSSFMWDGAINHLDMQSLAPITHPKEMNESIDNVVKKLQANQDYKKHFYKAYGDSLANGEYILKSISQFLLTLTSATSKYDSVMQQKAEFTSQEMNGYNLFKSNCSSCHKEPLFSDFSFKNNGLPIDTFLNDEGRYSVTKKTEDLYTFKVPSLRNIEYTYPYMHDGRFKKLRQVINHYTDGIRHTSSLDPLLQKPIILTSNEQVDLIAFLLTLSDRAFVFDKRHGYVGVIDK